MQQGVQTDTACNIQQCWEMMAKKVASVFTGLISLLGRRRKWYERRGKWMGIFLLLPRPLPCANGRNIVGQQLRTLLEVTCCVRLDTLLYVVACGWE